MIRSSPDARAAGPCSPLVALPWLAVELGATPAQVGIITGFFFLPTLVVGPMGGVLADRVERRTVLISAQLVAALLSGVVFVLVLAEAHSLPILAAASFGFGMLIALDTPPVDFRTRWWIVPTELPSAVAYSGSAPRM